MKFSSSLLRQDGEKKRIYLADAYRAMRDRNAFGAMMVKLGKATRLSPG